MRVYVTMRNCQEFTLTLGVFAELAAAKAYVEEVAKEPTLEWREPGPGSQHWELHRRGFSYFIEEHVVR